MEIFVRQLALLVAVTRFFTGTYRLEGLVLIAEATLADLCVAVVEGEEELLSWLPSRAKEFLELSLSADLHNQEVHLFVERLL